MPVTLERLGATAKQRPWGVAQLTPWFDFLKEPGPLGEVWFDAAPADPLLIKFLFTSENLSVQVHPDDLYARRHHAEPRGKTEMWHILDARPGAKIAAGFREPLTPDQMRQAAETGEIEQLLEWCDAKPGDTFFIPAGTVHAIGAGLVLCEIQENSDITYRLYDYGRGRELHLDHGIAVAFRTRHAARQASEGVLVSCPHFTVEKWRGEGNATLTVRPLQLLIVIGGEGTLGKDAAQTGQVFRVHTSGPSASLAVAGNLTLLIVSLIEVPQK